MLVLNPKPDDDFEEEPFVSILVLMDVGLKHSNDVLSSREESNVSILVLMDVGLKQRKLSDLKLKNWLCFNPCFDGCWS